MRAIVVDDKVIVLKHWHETERGCTLRAELGQGEVRLSGFHNDRL